MMSDTRTDQVLLEHLGECIERIREYTGGYDRTRFDGSRMVQDAVVRNLQILAESTQRLGEPLKATEPDIPWRAIAGFRNVLAHDYLGLDTAVIWSVVERDLPELASAIERMSAAAARLSE